MQSLKECAVKDSQAKRTKGLKPAYFSPLCSSFRHRFRGSTGRKTGVANKLDSRGVHTGLQKVTYWRRGPIPGVLLTTSLMLPLPPSQKSGPPRQAPNYPARTLSPPSRQLSKRSSSWDNERHSTVTTSPGKPLPASDRGNHLHRLPG